MNASPLEGNGPRAKPLKVVDRICDDFEAAWRTTGRPDIAEFLAEAEDSVQAHLLLELVSIDLEWRIKSGEGARVEEYFRAWPELWTDEAAAIELVAVELELRQQFDGGVTVSEYGKRFPDRISESIERRQLQSEETLTPATARHPDTPSNDETLPIEGLPSSGAGRTEPLPQIPGYEVLQLVASGGMGAVFKGRDLKLNRTIAIKLPHTGLINDKEGRERFLREARAAAQLRHPNICPIYETAEVEGRSHIVMGFVAGPSLQQRAQEGLSAREAAEFVAKLARAVAYAHGQGIIHRDIKPGNVLIDAETNEPILTDFGLAKHLSDVDSDMTQTGQVMGTPAFMAPEQAAGDKQRIGPSVDVYALGAVLYTLLCHRPPFEGSVAEILAALRSDEPPPPRKLIPRLHRDLATICLKALAKQPADRYATAEALAEDLDRFCAGEVIRARPVSRASRLVRKAQRHPRVTAVVVSCFLVALLAATVTWTTYRRNQQVAELRATFSDQVVQLEQIPPRDAVKHVADIEATQKALDIQSPADAHHRERQLQRALTRYVNQSVQQERLPDAEIRYLRDLIMRLRRWGAEQEADRLARQVDNVTRGWRALPQLNGSLEEFTSLLPAGELSVEDDMILRTKQPMRNSHSPRMLLPVNTPSNVRFEIGFTGDWRQANRLGLLLGDMNGHNSDVISLAFSPDGRWLASGGADDDVRLWEVESGQLARVLPTGGGVRDLVFSADGTRLATASWSSSQGLWNCETGQKIDERRATTNIAVSADRSVIATGFDQKIVVQAIDDGRVLEEFTYPHAKLLELVLSDENTLITIDRVGRIIVWDRTDWSKRRVLAEEQEGSKPRNRLTVAFAHKTSRLAVPANDGIVHVWKIHSEQEPIRLEHRHDVKFLQFSRDGTTLTTAASVSGYLWDAATGSLLWEIEGDRGPGIDGWSFSGDGRHIVEAGGGKLRLRDVKTGRKYAGWTGHVRQMRALAVHPATGRVATGGRDRLVKLWDPASQQMLATLGGRQYSLILAPTHGQTDSWRLQLYRGKTAIADDEIQLPSDGSATPLRMELERLNGHVVASLQEEGGQTTTLEFDEVFPLRSRGDAQLGIVWPTDVGVTGAWAYERQEAELRRVWHFAEKNFVEGRFDVAREMFANEVARLDGRFTDQERRLWQEALYKEAACLLALDEIDTAVAKFQQLAQQPTADSTWPTYAKAQLVARHVVNDEVAEAESLLEELSEDGIDFRQLAIILPADARMQLRDLQASQSRGLGNWYRFNPNRVKQLTRIGQIEEMVHGSIGAATLVWLMRAHRLDGNLEAALALGAKYTSDENAYEGFVEEQAWMLREAGKLDEAAALLDRFLSLGVTDRRTDDYRDLLLDRALVDVARGDKAAALRKVDELFAIHSESRTLTLPGNIKAQLIRGFLLDDLGRSEEAKESWRLGFEKYRGYRERYSMSTADWMYYLVLGTSSGELTAEDLAGRLDQVLADQLGGSTVGSVLSSLLSPGQKQLVSEEILNAWRSERGQQIARGFAYQSLTFPELVRDPALLMFNGVMARLVAPGGLSEAEEDLLWELSRDWYHRVLVEGNEKMSSLVPVVALTLVKAPTQWRLLDTQVSEFPDLRGPQAYFFGLRNLLKENTDEATECFETALEHAGENEILKTLAEEHLVRLGG